MYKGILSLSWPIMLEMGVQMLIMNVNTFMISRLGDQAVAAVGTAGTILGVTTMVLGIIGFGSTTLIAQYFGAGDKRTLMELIVESVRANLCTAIAISALLQVFWYPLFHVMHVPADIWGQTCYFFRIMSLFLFISSFNMICSGILRNLGETRKVFYFSLVSVSLTVVFNAVLILGLFGFPRMGINGLLISNVVAASVEGVLKGGFLYKRLPFPINWKHAAVQWKHTKRIFQVGIPSAIELGSYQLTQFLMVSIISLLGTFAITTRVYSTSVESMSFLFGMGISQGVAILVGHQVGRFDYPKARSISMNGIVIGVGIMSLISVILFAFGNDFISLFTTNEDVISSGGGVLKIIALAQPAKALNMVVGGALRGAGDNKWLMWNSGLFVWLSVLFAYVLGFPFHFGLYGVWWGMFLDEWIRAILVFRRLKGNRWYEKSYVQPVQAK